MIHGMNEEKEKMLIKISHVLKSIDRAKFKKLY